jgi:hypothetical protein
MQGVLVFVDQTHGWLLTHTLQMMPTNVMSNEAAGHKNAGHVHQVSLEAIKWSAGWNPLLIVPTSKMPVIDSRFATVGAIELTKQCSLVLGTVHTGCTGGFTAQGGIAFLSAASRVCGVPDAGCACRSQCAQCCCPKREVFGAASRAPRARLLII